LELRQLVHRERDAHRLWQSSAATWQWRDGAWRHAGNGPARLQFVPPDQPITDDLATNQQVTRQLNLVSDLMITCLLTAVPGPRVVARAVGLKEDAEAEMPLAAEGIESQELVVSWFDQQLTIAIAGRVVERRLSPMPWPVGPRLEIEGS